MGQKLESLIKILDKEKELNNINLIRMISTRTFKNKELINADDDLFLTVDSLITINNYITGSRTIQLRQVNVRPAFYFNKQYMDFTKIEPELYKLVDQFNDRKITPRTFCDIFLDKIHPFAFEMAEHANFYLKIRFKFHKKCLSIIFSKIMLHFL